MLRFGLAIGFDLMVRHAYIHGHGQRERDARGREEVGVTVGVGVNCVDVVWFLVFFCWGRGDEGSYFGSESIAVVPR